MQHFIEIYDDESGILLTKVGGKDAAQVNQRALGLLSNFATLEYGPKWVWFIDPKTGAASKHVAPKKTPSGSAEL